MWLGVSLQCSGWCWPDETVCTHKNVLMRERRLLDLRDGTRVFRCYFSRIFSVHFVSFN